ncbi:MAG: sigma-70 family RNA polymerase sigma factor [Oscillospiraceae bacterium]
MDLLEDELLDDDFSDEEESEELSEDNALDLVQDGFADWVDASDGAPEDERLEEALAEERTLELESELEQDEHPRDYAAELDDEDEEDEAAPKNDKRLKREILAEALKRTEESARTLKDFQGVIAEWDRLDRNRERRERDHENLRGDVPLEFQAVPEPRIVPLWMNAPDYRQLCSGFFLDILFDCPYEMHELTADEFISNMIRNLSEEHKEVLFYLSLRLYSTTRLAALRGQSDRNIRKLRLTIHKKLQRAFYQHLQEKQAAGNSLTLREQEFFRVFGELLQTMGKNAVIRPENKTPPRKKKAVLDEAKDG